MFAQKLLVPAGVVTALFASSFGASAETPRVVLEAPSSGASLLGEVDVAFAVHGAPAGAVTQANVVLDGRVVAALTAPPWRTKIDAGADLGPHRLEVIVILKDGRRLKAGFTSQRTPGTSVEVRLVNLAVTVTDRAGKTVTGLGREDFQVFDEGQPVKLTHWEAAPAALAVAFVLDTSLTMQGDRIAEAKRAADAFVKELGPEDRAMLISFSDDVQIRAPLDTDHAGAISQIEKLVAGGGTALYDAVYSAADELKKAPPELRKIVVLLSDGRDEAANGLEPGSFHTLEEAIRQAHFADATVFSCGLGSILDRETDFTGRMTTAEVLDRFARSTGGFLQRITRGTRLGPAFRSVLEEVRRQYGMAYRPPAPGPGETWRKVEVRVSRPGLKVRTREGYFVE
jgi:Ca-activated chloride channel family protein